MTEDQAMRLVAAWRTKADDLMRISKAYKCRSNETVRIAYIKQSQQLQMCADELEKQYASSIPVAATPAEYVEADAVGSDVSNGPDGEHQHHSPERQSSASEEPQDKAPGSVHVPALRTRQGRARPAGGSPSTDV